MEFSKSLFALLVLCSVKWKGVLGQSLSFETSLYTFTTQETAVDEGIVPDYGFLTARCTDTSGEVDLITYDIPNRISLGLPFRIHPTSGDFFVADGQILDYEFQTFYSFQIECFNSVDPETSASAMVNITLIDVNEFVPEIMATTLFASIPEDAPIGQTLASTLPIPEQDDVTSTQYPPATDRDSGPQGIVRYYFSADDDPDSLLNFFDLNPATGTVTVAREGIDVDSIPGNSYVLSIRITACDTDPPRDLCPNIELNVVITAANDNAPTFTQDSYSATLNESVPVGTSVVTVLCTDNDAGFGALSGYSIYRVVPPSESNAFTILADGAVLINNSLDYEITQEYQVVLRCFDSGGREDFANLTVTVEPLNDNEPEFTHAVYEFTLNKLTLLGQTIGRVEAIDNDTDIGGDVTYTLVTDLPDVLDLKQDGSIVLKTFAFSYNDSYGFSINASDGTYTTSADVLITSTGVLSLLLLIVIIAVAVLVLALLCYVCCCCYRCNKKQHKPTRSRRLGMRSEPMMSMRIENPEYVETAHTELVKANNVEENESAVTEDNLDKGTPHVAGPVAESATPDPTGNTVHETVNPVKAEAIVDDRIYSVIEDGVPTSHTTTTTDPSDSNLSMAENINWGTVKKLPSKSWLFGKTK